MLSGLLSSAAVAAGNPPSPGAPPVPPEEPKQAVTVQAPEPRYVAPTLRDQIGRIWAPVYINGKGPFRLVIDTGASRSAVTASVAQALGITPDGSQLIKLNGVTGSAVVPSIRVDSVLVGDLLMKSVVLPIVPNVFGGAEGVLGTEGLLDKRIVIDFRHDSISIRRSHERRAPDGFDTISLDISRNRLITTQARVGSIPVTAVIDTGAESSIANLALREALARRRFHRKFSRDDVFGATNTVAQGEGSDFPPIYLGDIQIQGAHITTGDMHIFDVWDMTRQPAILIGMDALGKVDAIIIDYRRSELQILVHHSGYWPLIPR